MSNVDQDSAIPSVQRSVEDPLLSNAVNAGGTLNILLAAREEGVKQLIYASSSAIYGDDPVLPKKEEMSPSPLSPYALQKYVGERYCQLFFELYGLETVSLRYFNIFGPKQDPTSVYSGSSRGLSAHWSRIRSHRLRRWGTIAGLHLCRECGSGKPAGHVRRSPPRRSDQYWLWEEDIVE